MHKSTILKALAASATLTGGGGLFAENTTNIVENGNIVVAYRDVGEYTWTAPADIGGATVLIVGGGGGGARRRDSFSLPGHARL